MNIVIADENQVKTIVDMSVRAFETDIDVGGTKVTVRLNMIR